MIFTESKHGKAGYILLKMVQEWLKILCFVNFGGSPELETQKEELQQALNDLRNCEYWKGGCVNIVTGLKSNGCL